MQNDRLKQSSRITWIGMGVNALLVLVKLFAGTVANSTAMVADGVHSLSDGLTDVVVLFSLRYADREADEGHPFGHGKIETLATVIIAFFLFTVGFRLAASGFEKILFVFRGGVLAPPGILALYAALLSIAAKEVLFRFTHAIGKAANRPAVVANAWHHRSDALSSVGTALGIGGAIFLGRDFAILDPLAALIVCAVLFKVAWDLLRPAVDELLEASLSKEERQALATIIDGVPGVRGHHALTTRRSGSQVIITVHVLVDPDLTIVAGHDVATAVSQALKTYYEGQCLCEVHIEPEGRHVHPDDE